MVHRRIALLAGLLCALLWGAAPAAQPLPLRYGGDRDFAPFESREAGGVARGFQIDLLRELATVGDFELTIEMDDWPAVEAGLRSGRFDAIAMVDVPVRREWALFARSHATPALALYHLATQRAPQSLQALAGQTVAVSGGQPMRETHAALAGVNARFIELPTPLAALKAVASGAAGLAVLPRAYGDRLIAAGDVPGVVAADFSLRLQSYAFAVAPGNEALRQRIDAALAELEASGRLEALRLKWLSSHRETARVSRLTVARASDLRWFAVAASGGALLLGLLVWQLRLRSRRLRIEGTRRREAELALAQARAHLEHSFTRHPDAMLVTALDSGEVQDVNHALCTLLGLEREALLGRALATLPGLDDPANLLALRHILDQEGALNAVPLRVQRPDGQIRSCLVTCELIPVGAGEHAFAILRDVTEQLQSNETLRAGYDDLTLRLASMASALSAETAGRIEAQGSAASYTATVSHDLKAPLRAVRGFVGLLRGNLDNGRLDQARSNAVQIDKAAQRMEGLVAGLARLSDVNRAPLSLIEVPMGSLAAETSTLVAAAHPMHRVEWQIDAALPTCRADADLVMQVWQNLLDNAWKFTAKSTPAKVRVDGFSEGGRRWYRVTDNGAGFDSARATRLFQPFQRMHSPSEFEGTGIGLSTVQRIVHRHGGEIRARSQVGVGTIVEFTLDAAPVA